MLVKHSLPLTKIPIKLLKCFNGQLLVYANMQYPF